MKGSEVAVRPGLARYAALAQGLQARVLAGEWRPGDPLPAEQDLAAAHGVALGTVRQALALLVAQGLIERIQGRGTFVRAGLSGATLLRFFRFGLPANGGVPGSVILDRQTVAAPDAAAQALGIEAGSAALYLRRLRSLDGRPCLLEQIWLPLPAFAPLAAGDTQAWGDLLYPLYAAHCGLHVHSAVDEISFGTFAAADAQDLGLATGHPAAVVTRRALDLAGRCIEFRITRGDAQAFHYAVHIQ